MVNNLSFDAKFKTAFEYVFQHIFVLSKIPKVIEVDAIIFYNLQSFKYQGSMTIQNLVIIKKINPTLKKTNNQQSKKLIENLSKWSCFGNHRYTLHQITPNRHQICST